MRVKSPKPINPEMAEGLLVWCWQAMPVKIASTKAAINLISTFSDVDFPSWGKNRLGIEPRFPPCFGGFATVGIPIQ